MIIDFLILIAGALLIWGGANYMTDGSSALARRWGVSELMIGLTVVAFGSSAPDLAVCLLSTFRGHEGLAVGNVVGSNIFDVFMVVGVCWLVRPMRVSGDIVRTQLPFMVLVYIVVLIFSNDRFLDYGEEDLINRSDGLILLILYGLYLAYTISTGRDVRKEVPGHPAGNPSLVSPSYKESSPTGAHSVSKVPTSDSYSNSTVAIPHENLKMWLIAIYIIGGLGALIGGGEMFVNGASGIARKMNISETMIGLTVVALGTSLPDLATSLAAALKNKPGLAIGNVVGSCLFDALIVLGACSLVKPLPLGTISNVDLLTMLGGGLFFWLSARYYKSVTLTRIEGAVLAAGYIAYTIYLIIGVAHL